MLGNLIFLVIIFSGVKSQFEDINQTVLSFVIIMEETNVQPVTKDVTVDGQVLSLTCFENIELKSDNILIGVAEECFDIRYVEASNNRNGNVGFVLWDQTMFDFVNGTSALQENLITAQPILVSYVEPDTVLDYTHIIGGFPTNNNFVGTGDLQCYEGTVHARGALNMNRLQMSDLTSGSFNISYVWLFNLVEMEDCISSI